MSDDREQLLADWWEHHRLGSGNRAERKSLEQGHPASAVAAYAIVSELVESGDVSTVQLLADLNDAGPREDDGAIVGAGPLEDLVHAHGDELIDEIERLARQVPSFRRALASVWIDDGAISPATHDRISRGG